MARRSPLRDTMGRVSERIGEVKGRVGDYARRLGDDIKGAWGDSARAPGAALEPAYAGGPGGGFGGFGGGGFDIGRPVRAFKNFMETRSNRPLSGGGSGTPTAGAVALQKRAWELNRMRSEYNANNGTTAAMKVRNTKSGKVEVRISTNLPDDVMPIEWEGQFKPGERFIGGRGHAEQTIIESLGDDWEVVEGGTSRNICTSRCSPLIEGQNLEIGGPRFRTTDPTYTDYRMFWKKEE